MVAIPSLLPPTRDAQPVGTDSPSSRGSTTTPATIGHSTPADDRFDQPQTVDRVATAASTTAVAPSDGRPILLYNANCQVCRVLSGWVKRQDASGRDLIDERPIGGDPSALTALSPGLDIWKVYEKIHLIMPDGEVKIGGKAIAEVLKSLPATSWFAGIFDLGIGEFKPFLVLLDGAYNVLDAIRPALGCESCGGGPVAWWALPIKWTADAFKAVRKALT